MGVRDARLGSGRQLFGVVACVPETDSYGGFFFLFLFFNPPWRTCLWILEKERERDTLM